MMNLQKVNNDGWVYLCSAFDKSKEDVKWRREVELIAASISRNLKHRVPANKFTALVSFAASMANWTTFMRSRLYNSCRNEGYVKVKGIEFLKYKTLPGQESSPVMENLREGEALLWDEGFYATNKSGQEHQPPGIIIDGKAA